MVRLVHALDCLTEYGFFNFQQLGFPVTEPAGWASPHRKVESSERCRSADPNGATRSRGINNLALLRNLVRSRRNQSSCGRTRGLEQFSPVQWVDRLCRFAGANAFGGFPASQKLLDGLFKLLVNGADFLPSAAV